MIYCRQLGTNILESLVLDMTVPKYVQAMMEVTHFVINSRKDGLYNIRVGKYTKYKRTETMDEELERLCKWMERNSLYFKVITNYPRDTRYHQQYADCLIDLECAKAMLPYIGADFHWHHKGLRHVPKELQQYLND